MNRAYFVVGPEASGNRLMVELLVDAGCFGAGQETQPVDGPAPSYPVVLPESPVERLAFYRSLPHGGTWPRLVPVIRHLRQAGYRATLLAMLRSQDVVEQSQLRAGHVETIEQARANVRRAWQAIYCAGTVPGVGLVVVDYSQLGSASYREWLTDVLELPRVPATEFREADVPYRVTVVTNGCFDLLHAGHVDLLQRARQLGDRLVVLVNSDRSVQELKGPGRPVCSQHERVATLRSLRSVDEVILVDSEEELEARLAELRPDVLAKGSDWSGRKLTGEQHAGRVELLPLLPGYSTTSMIYRATRAAYQAEQGQEP